MPTVPVTTHPIQLSQVITQSALIQNNGSGTLYLADNASVSSVAYALRVTPGATVTWPANSELWGVSDTSCTVGVLYGATGASVSQVSVTGPLTVGSVLAPVSIQGGAGSLYSNTVTVPAGQSISIFLPTSIGNLTYPSLYATLSVSQNNQNISYQLVYGPPPYAYANGSIVYTDMAMSVLYPYQTAFTVPWITGTGPILSLTNNGTAPTDVVVNVFGVSTLTTKPTTDLSWSIGVGAFSMPASDNALQIPGSFDPFYVIATTTSAVATAFTLTYNGQSVTVPVGTASGTVYTFMSYGGNATSRLLTTNRLNTPVNVLISSAPPPLSVNDTGWLTMTLIGGAIVVDSYTPQYRRKNGIVSLRGRLNMVTGPTFWNVPPGFRAGSPPNPAGGRRYPVMTGSSGATPAVVAYDTSGSALFSAAGTVINLDPISWLAEL